MTEGDIKGLVAALSGAIVQKDEKTAATAALGLLEAALLDLHRIADALEALSVQ